MLRRKWTGRCYKLPRKQSALEEKTYLHKNGKMAHVQGCGKTKFLLFIHWLLLATLDMGWPRVERMSKEGAYRKASCPSSMCPEVELKKPTHKERAVQQDQRVPDNHGLLEIFLSRDAVFRHYHSDLKTAEPRSFPTHTPMLYGITRGCNSHPSPPSEVERGSVGVWTSSTNC